MESLFACHPTCCTCAQVPITKANVNLNNNSFLCAPQTSWVLIEFGVQPWHLYLSRVLSGLSSGGGFCLVPVFVSEICESQ